MSKILIRKGKKEYVKELEKEITIVKEKQFYVDDLSKDYHTQYGTISKGDLKKDGRIESSQKKEFSVFDADFIDNYKRIKRLPQIIPLKDIGFIITKTGLNADYVVIEAGSGSGGLSLFLAQYVKKIYSYDISKENQKIVEENIIFLNSKSKNKIKNIVLKNKSAYEGFDEKNVDLICLDLPEPWSALGSVQKSLRRGGFIVSYSPSILQTAEFVNALIGKTDFVHLKTVEMIEREWEIDKQKTRPKSKTNIHSGFLTLGRKI